MLNLVMNMIPMTFLLLVISCISVALKIAASHCPCDSEELCKQYTYFSNHKEVTVVTEGKSDFTTWHWEGIHNVINAAEKDDPKLMCQAHSQKVNYGILEKIAHNDSMTKVQWDNWMDNVLKRANDIYADFIALDMLDLVGHCFLNKEHGDEVINLTKSFVERMKSLQSHKDFKIACVLPWKPPCIDGNCNIMGKLSKFCDMVLTSPESYVTKCDTHCRAKATMPISNLIIGTDEYLFREDTGVTASKFSIGIPWHGYDYKCDYYEKHDRESICRIKKKKNSTQCDFKSSRTKITYYELETQYRTQFEKTNHWSNLYHSRFFDVNETNNGTSTGVHQIWYESDDTLYEKYRFANQMKLRGVVIWTVDDLLNYHKGDAGEWNWMLHTMMLTDDFKKGDDMHMALKAMAIGVGCFIGGTLVGAIITTAIARRQMKLMNRSYKRPFHKDEDEDDETANFHEDDKYL